MRYATQPVGDRLVLDFQRPSWWGSAACRGQVDLFFDERRQAQAEALRICAGCPVREPCAAEARRFETVLYQISGTRAGLTAGQRGRRRGSSAAPLLTAP